MYHIPMQPSNAGFKVFQCVPTGHDAIKPPFDKNVRCVFVHSEQLCRVTGRCLLTVTATVNSAPHYTKYADIFACYCAVFALSLRKRQIPSYDESYLNGSVLASMVPLGTFPLH